MGPKLRLFPACTGLGSGAIGNAISAFLTPPRLETSTVESLNLATTGTDSSWPREDVVLKNESLFSGPVMSSELIQAFYFTFDATRVGYELRALDLSTGKFLWDRDYGGAPSSNGILG
jgi:glucose dehydrogenase